VLTTPHRLRSTNAENFSGRKNSAAMADIFNALHHICIVVHDVEKSAAYYALLGVGPWQDYPPLSSYAELDVPNLDAFRGLKFKFVNLENVQLQLCQPNEENCPQRRFLDIRGEGVFHLGFDVPDCDASEKTGAALGLVSLMRGRRDDRSGFTFFDTSEKAGVVLEIRSSPAPSNKNRT
jgi:methylmalonyl-CoA/ethylmalonyl-CoA epimerase